MSAPRRRRLSAESQQLAFKVSASAQELEEGPDHGGGGGGGGKEEGEERRRVQREPNKPTLPELLKEVTKVLILSRCYSQWSSQSVRTQR
ncbi:hypothetical protein CgunFtcFv8_004708 [Champsocephalus gunnari]|uniref:Uncharacterized protein n=1 Tax=Champsocephalus gunnari TaxID=52237 RepID=A0AAN8E1N7_CHAGU|nr:hypothetical protein CgunFtcFv8_004708 [Champsocephalus gunnari]